MKGDETPEDILGDVDDLLREHGARRNPPTRLIGPWEFWARYYRNGLLLVIGQVLISMLVGAPGTLGFPGALPRLGMMLVVAAVWPLYYLALGLAGVLALLGLVLSFAAPLLQWLLGLLL